MISRELLEKTVSNFGVKINDEQFFMFDKFACMLLEWNKKFNLTAIKNPDEIVEKHFADSLTVMKNHDFTENKKLIDVGTGAGFPGIPLLIMNSSLQAVLIDSTGKKISFIDAVLKELSLNAQTIVSRAETIAAESMYREKFDYSTARAVSELRIISELCLPFIKIGGKFIALKGAKAQEEINLSLNAIKILGGKIANTESFTLPSGGERNVISIKKISQTPTKYPRNFSQISKHPL